MPHGAGKSPLASRNPITTLPSPTYAAVFDDSGSKTTILTSSSARSLHEWDAASGNHISSWSGAASHTAAASSPSSSSAGSIWALDNLPAYSLSFFAGEDSVLYYVDRRTAPPGSGGVRSIVTLAPGDKRRAPEGITGLATAGSAVYAGVGSEVWAYDVRALSRGPFSRLPGPSNRPISSLAANDGWIVAGADSILVWPRSVAQLSEQDVVAASTAWADAGSAEDPAPPTPPAPPTLSGTRWTSARLDPPEDGGKVRALKFDQDKLVASVDTSIYVWSWSMIHAVGEAQAPLPAWAYALTTPRGSRATTPRQPPRLGRRANSNPVVGSSGSLGSASGQAAAASTSAAAAAATASVGDASFTSNPPPPLPDFSPDSDSDDASLVGPPLLPPPPSPRSARRGSRASSNSSSGDPMAESFSRRSSRSSSSLGNRASRTGSSPTPPSPPTARAQASSSKDTRDSSYTPFEEALASKSDLEGKEDGQLELRRRATYRLTGSGWPPPAGPVGLSGHYDDVFALDFNERWLISSSSVVALHDFDVKKSDMAALLAETQDRIELGTGNPRRAGSRWRWCC